MKDGRRKKSKAQRRASAERGGSGLDSGEEASVEGFEFVVRRE
jgi:hypothetical protein